MNGRVPLPTPGSTDAHGQGLSHEALRRKGRTSASRFSQSRAVNDEPSPPLPESSEAHLPSLPVELWVEKIKLMLLRGANHSRQMWKHLFLFLNQLMHLPKHYKMRLSAVQEIFEFEETPLVKVRIMQETGKKLSDHKYQLKHEYYDKYETTEERLENVPEGICKDD